MFRPMRRKNRAISEEAAKALLKKERRGVLAVNGDDGYPYAVPVNFYFDEANQKIYFHGACAGHKADAIRRCDKVCFTVYGNETAAEESWAPYMQSVVVFGSCRVILNEAEKLDKLRLLAGKYYPETDLVEEEIAKSGQAARMYEIEIRHLSGKQIQEK